MGIFGNLFRKKDPIELEWEQERRVAYKSALQRARMKEAERVGFEHAKIEANKKIEASKSRQGGGFFGAMQRFDKGIQTFGSGLNNGFGRPLKTRMRDVPGNPGLKKLKKKKIRPASDYYEEEPQPGLTFFDTGNRGGFDILKF